MTNEEIEGKMARDGCILRELMTRFLATSGYTEAVHFTLILACMKAGEKETLCTMMSTFGLDQSIEALEMLKTRLKLQEVQEG